MTSSSNEEATVYDVDQPDDDRPAAVPHLRVVDSTDADVLGTRRNPGRIKTSWSATDLMAMTFDPPRWAVPGLICEGVSLLCGPPKVGKSWLALALGLAVASGGRAFDSIPVEGGPVLYLALEDTPRRLQSRIATVLGGQPAPAALTLATACPPLPQGGDEAIANWLDRNRDARMVIIDVFAKLRGASAPGASAYDADYTAVGRIKKVADHYGIAVLMVHHVRKAASEDFLSEVSGTNGIAGAADATLVLKRPRGQADGVLHVTGRDVDEAEYALGFQPASGAWYMLDGPAQDHAVGDTRGKILRWLRDNPGSRPKVIAEVTDTDYELVKKTLQRMLADGQVIADARGSYRLPGAVGDSAHGSVPPVPAVPELAMSSANSTSTQGHRRDELSLRAQNWGEPQ
ncbi:AAA family ATPase [Dactylosporangium sp. NPDC051541]|uniref:AAA family ATPase n=1 Tax=Dactylosporangium sp. NPDC051541 TaxID=3363977 RepID=UPI0037B222DA